MNEYYKVIRKKQNLSENEIIEELIKTGNDLKDQQKEWEESKRWQDASEHDRISSRAAADHIRIKLSDLGYKLYKL